MREFSALPATLVFRRREYAGVMVFIVCACVAPGPQMNG